MYGALLECSVVVPQSLYRNVALFYFLVGVVGGVGAAGPPPMPVHATKFGVWRAVALGVFFYLSIFLSCCILYPPPYNKTWSLEGSSIGCFLRINVFMFLYSVSASMQQSLEFGGQ